MCLPFYWWLSAMIPPPFAGGGQLGGEKYLKHFTPFPAKKKDEPFRLQLNLG
jgi:hypothetical protein